MQNGGKKWSGLCSNSILLILFFFQREMERKRNARWKSRRIRTILLSYRRQNEEEEEVDTTAVPWAELKRRNFYLFPQGKKGHFFLRYLSREAKNTNIFGRTSRKRPKIWTREKAFFFFFTLFHTHCFVHVCCFYIHTILHALTLTLALLFKYTLLLLRSVVLNRGGPH